MWGNGVQSGGERGIGEGGECDNVPVSGKAPITNGLLLVGCVAEHHTRKFGLGENGAMLLREGAEPRGAEMFYREVVQEILLYGSETWVLLAEIERKAERTHIRFL